MKTRVYIPSRSRFEIKTHTTLASLPADIQANYVVPTDQLQQYQYMLKSRPDVKIWCSPDDGIALTRKFIGLHAWRRKLDSFVMLDDDLRFYIRKDFGSPTDWHLRYAEPDEVGRAIEELLNACVIGYGAASISAREGNNRHVGEYTENTRLLRVLAFNTKQFMACEHGRVAVMEDFDVLLQLLRLGSPNRCLYWYAQGQSQTQAPGGCSDYRTHKLHEKSATELARLHPDFVRLREKKNRSGGAFGVRKEVTIQWQKAFKSATAAGLAAAEQYDKDRVAQRVADHEARLEEEAPIEPTQTSLF